MIRIYLILISILYGENLFSQQAQLAEIYSVGISYRVKDFSKKKVVVIDSTTNQFSKSIKQFIHFITSKDNPDSSWIESLINFNYKNISLQNILSGSKNLSLFSNQKNQELFSNDIFKSWDIFHKKYPEYLGIINLSPVYFNNDNTQACYILSLATTWCGNGRNGFIFLKKDKSGKWIKSEFRK
jgi:hypothetical protein